MSISLDAPTDIPIDGSHPFYLDTRYYEVAENGTHTLLTGNASTDADYVSYSHGVYLRNAHGMDVLLQPTNITWRTLGGSIDLYFFDGPTQPEVTKQFQYGAIGLPAMQQVRIELIHERVSLEITDYDC